MWRGKAEPRQQGSEELVGAERQWSSAWQGKSVCHTHLYVDKAVSVNIPCLSNSKFAVQKVCFWRRVPGGVRTHACKRTPDLESGSLDHSDTGTVFKERFGAVSDKTQKLHSRDEYIAFVGWT